MTIKRAALYARYSSDLQSPTSIADQLALCRTYAAREGYTIVAEYSDAARSGASMIGRDGFLRMMADAKAGKFRAVIVEALDRLSRSQADLAAIYERLTFAEVDIVQVHGGIADDLHVGFGAIAGQMFLNNLKQKIHRGMTGAVRAGKNAGGKTYGYKPVPGKPGELVIDEDQAKIVNRFWAEFAAGISPRNIVHRFNNEGIPGPHGGRWNASTLNGAKRRGGLLRNPLYVGKRIWNKGHMVKHPDTGRRLWRANPESEWQTFDDPALRIVDQAVFDAVQARLADRVRAHSKGESSPRKKHLLSGLLQCATCGGGMSLQGLHYGRQRVRCSTARESGSCTNRKPYYLDEIVACVVTHLRDFLSDRAVVDEFVKTYTAEWRDLNAKAVRERDSIGRNLDRCEGAIKRFTDALDKGSMPIDILTAKLQELEAERQGLRADLARATKAVPKIVVMPQAVKAYHQTMSNLADNLAGLRDAGPEAMMAAQQLIDRVRVHPGDPPHAELVGRIMALTGAKETANPDRLLRVVAEEGVEPPTPGL